MAFTRSGWKFPEPCTLEQIVQYDTSLIPTDPGVVEHGLKSSEKNFSSIPIACLPPALWFSHLLNKDQNVKIEAHESFVKQTIRSRFRILSANGIQILTVPVVHENVREITRIRISYQQAWQKQHWKSLESAYNNSPYFLYYRDVIEPVFKKNTEFLFDYNLELIKTICEITGINQKLSFTQTYSKTADEEFPEKEYWTRIESLNGLPYHQVFIEKFGFVSHLSILDVLFNLGPDTLTYINGLLKA